MSAVTLRALPAKCGDCLVVEYGDNGDRPHRILIDGGLKSGFDEGLGRYLAETDDQPTEFDIVVVTHIDLDHIQGVIEAIEQDRLRTENIWFNGRDQIDELVNTEGGSRGPRQGDALDELIPPQKRNPVVDGKAIVVPEAGVFELPGMPGGARCTLLSPSRDRLERLLKKWPKPTRGDPLKDLFDAFDDDADDDGTRAAGVFGKDGSAANGSSIAFLLEVDGASLLLTGDAYARVLEDTIKRLLDDRGVDKLDVDLFKLSHHGSRQNMTDDLLDLIRPANILICTDGSKFKHPDADALQKIRSHFPSVPIHFTDDTDIITQRAGSIGVTPPSADELPVELRFGTATDGDAPSSAKKSTKKSSAKKSSAKKSSSSKQSSTPRRGSRGRGSNGVDIREENLNVKLEWGGGGTSRGGAIDDLSARLAHHQPAEQEPVRFEVVAEATVHEVEQRRSGGRGADGGGDEPGELVVELGRSDADEARVVLVEENGQYGWFIPDGDADEVALAATLAPPGSRGRITNLVRRKLRVIAIKGLRKAAGAATKAAVGAYEQRKSPAGLRTWTPSNYRTQLVEVPDLTHFDGEDRTLLVVHGFMGSIHGSFGFPEATVRRLSAAYDDRIIAYDHPTLTPNPRDNAEELLGRLEGHDLHLDILAHSRGGLVARELARLTAGSNIDIRSIVFVASPNGGTPMADPNRPSGLLDAVTNFVGNFPGTDGFALVLEMLADIVFKGALPGLEGLVAMQPDGDYLSELNKATTSPEIVLRSIAAEYEPAATAGFLQSKIDDGLDMYFGQQRNDRIVPTASPYVRTGNFQVRPGQRLVLDAARGVNHSTFWTDPRATRQLLTWLSADEDARTTPEIPESETDPEAEIAKVAESTSVEAIIDGVKSLPDTIRKKIGALTGGVADTALAPNGQRDAVIVLPGIMGSHLAVNGRTIWVDALRLTRGGLAELAFDAGGDVTPLGLNRTYVPLITRLARHWDVHLFPYDWRDDIFRSAARLDELVAKLRADHPNRGVNFVAHSMGGLVVRAFVAGHRGRWDELGDVDGAASGRLVMLGTPNRGSYSIPMTLLGSELAVRGLAAIDRKHNQRDVARIVGGFPGVYQMLPYAEGVEDDDWNDLYSTGKWGADHIDEKLLNLARDTHVKLGADGIDALRFCYVAGYGKDTPFRAKFEAKENGAETWDLRIGKFAMGDGRVAHALGQLDDMPMFFVDSTHGELISNPTVLDTIDDLVKFGRAETTDTFLDKAPARRGVGGELPKLVPIDEFDRQPLSPTTGTRGGAVRPPTTEDGRVIDDALSMLVGGESGAASRPRISVRVVHTSLEQTPYPVAVGHYARMPAEGAEGFLDWKLGGVLDARYRLGLTADDAGRAVVVRAPDGHCPGGALVVGLGEFGLLTESILTEGIADGVLRLARMRIEAGVARSETFGLSSVLIGTPGRFGLSIETSMVAIVEGIMGAMRQLGDDRPDVFDLEFIELYEQQADDAASVLCSIHDEIDHGLLDEIDLVIHESVESREGGRPGAPTHNASGRPWIRMQASLIEPDEDDPSPISEISVSVLARQAQADRIEHDVDLDKIGDYVSAAIDNSAQGNIGQTLYELLLPHRVKLELGRSENIHLIVDEQLGQLPWELLAARDSGGDARGALALRAGFLRQLQSLTVTRQGGVRPTGLQALVVGDPPTAYPRLPGARREAGEVAELLKSEGWTVAEHISKADDEPGNQWVDIDNMLHDAAYRVVHVAAHGIYEPDEPKRSGVVTGAGAHHRLTALDFRQMTVQPDLVFLNCCHLGRIEAADADRKLESWMNPQHLRQPHKVAATVATQLLQNGVKAVVVAGWEVDDQAAAAFSDKLYRCLLAAESFGDAVRKARAAAFDVTGVTSNTWGAYQCYGDPDFQLVTGARPGQGRPTIVSDNQLIQNLQILSSSAYQADDNYILKLGEELEELVEECGDRLDSAHVTLAIGDAYRSVGNFKKAADAYERCFLSKDGRGELRAIEQYANMLVRDAARAGGAADLVAFETATKKLEAVIAAVGETPERLSLLGSVYRKLAVVLAAHDEPTTTLESSLPKTAKEALDRAKRMYEEASDAALGAPEGALDPYSTNVWLQLEYGGSDSERDRGEHLSIGHDLLEIATKRSASASGFWDRSQLGDTLLTMALLDDGDGSEEYVRRAIDAYVRAFEISSTIMLRDSVRTYLDELIAIFGSLPADKAPGLGVIRELRRGLPSG
ncbi:MAG: alpha/beta fold hydrolase [Ilumatobacter sp.]|nr:alpha/beta fold hydrolase [Ilumatobacter sp.]